MVPTGRTYGLLLGGGLVATLLSNFSDAPDRLGIALAALLLFDGAVLAAMVWDGLQTQIRRATVRREPLHRLSIGRDNLITLHIESPGPADLRLYDHYPTAFAGDPLPLRVHLGAPGSQTVTFTVTPTHRGEYPWGDLQVQQRGAWGLAWADWTVAEAETVAVYPDLIGLRQLSVQLAMQATGSLKQKRRMGVGTEFAELREYGTGDDPRFIDWKATARLSQPLVRVLEPEREQTLLILLDRGRLMTAPVQGLSRFDWGLNAALSLGLAGVSRGDRVGLGVFDRSLHTWIPPKGGRANFQQLIERLTPIQPVLEESDYLAAATHAAQQQHRRALVVIITDIVDQTASAELLSALARLRPRHLPFCITLRDPAVDRQAQQRTTQVDAAYQRAVALDVLAQRQGAFSRLKQRGVLVLDAPADQISEPLVEAYLRIKTQGKL
ncbi:DUF58 domain-containing protein [Nodosilinea sp. P-1105]|uniref:DUF58 domain-containing protein n=1 Tax=Nodosilinea sp. P-1105 TaxID=2546229 RepID=UPI00146AFC98|nr:DUF58 domain-containing protein [Nodosilinea sp. P-1105]NMF84938.1 DUF58 domain-containing protein [Nodosilinea sp. P-1105]